MKIKNKYRDKINKKNKRIVYFDLVKEFIKNNLRQYLIVACLFVIGIVFGVIVLNYTKNQTYEQAYVDLSTFIENIKDGYEVNYTNLIKNLIINHSLITLILWFLGCSVIGIPLIYFIIAYKGFSLGFTISSIIFTLGNVKGILIVFAALLLQNIFIIPAIISIGVSSMNLYSSIMKNKRMENIKIEIIRHTFFSIVMLIVLIISAFVEAYISTFLLKMLISINIF